MDPAGCSFGSDFIAARARKQSDSSGDVKDQHEFHGDPVPFEGFTSQPPIQFLAFWPSRGTAFHGDLLLFEGVKTTWARTPGSGLTVIFGGFAHPQTLM